MPKLDPETRAYARRIKQEEEAEDISAFVDAYPHATGEILELVDSQESPDAICKRPDGSLIGLEHTRICRLPDEARWDAIYERRCTAARF